MCGNYGIDEYFVSLLSLPDKKIMRITELNLQITLQNLDIHFPGDSNRKK